MNGLFWRLAKNHELCTLNPREIVYKIAVSAEL